MGVPTMVMDMLQHESFSPQKVATLKSLAAGGAPVPPSQVGQSLAAHLSPSQVGQSLAAHLSPSRVGERRPPRRATRRATHCCTLVGASGRGTTYFATRCATHCATHCATYFATRCATHFATHCAFLAAHVSPSQVKKMKSSVKGASGGQAYGLTEVIAATVIQGKEYEERPTSCGKVGAPCAARFASRFASLQPLTRCGLVVRRGGCALRRALRASLRVASRRFAPTTNR
jgi:acyl-CoA synthetase (AMP-forming)/AMP-acid ligase II